MSTATAVSPEHIQALQKAKIGLMSKQDSAFFTSLAFSLRHVWNDKIPTARTDGRFIEYSPSFFIGLSPDERIFLMIHEAMHVAYMHMARCGNRNPRIFNWAADYVINLQLVDRGFKMPGSGLLDERFRGMYVEQVYDILMEEVKNQGEKPGWEDLVPLGSLGPGTDEDGGLVTEDEILKDIEGMLIRARIQSQMANDKPGTVPGDVELFLDRLLKPKLPWQRIVKKYFRRFDKNDYTWKKPSRRFFPDHYIPTLSGTKLIDLAIAVDISGSVSDHDFNVFVTEVHALMKGMRPAKITLIQFDTELHHVDEVKTVQELLKLKFHGRGGTDVHPVMDWAKEHKPELLMVFSDGDFYQPELPRKPQSDVLWLIHNNQRFSPNFGKVVHYTI